MVPALGSVTASPRKTQKCGESVGEVGRPCGWATLEPQAAWAVGVKGVAVADAEGFIGVFDSGLGGISVLRHLVRELPQERFVFFGDSAHAPYGEKSVEEVRGLVSNVVSGLVGEGAKAIVIACNTATSTSAALLREEYPDIPVIGVEPALKPAVEALPGGTVLVMATPITLRLDKFHELERRWEGGAHVVCAPCPGLASRIERGNLDGEDLHDLLEQLVGGYAGEAEGVVLGCTHYPFVRRQIARVLGEGVAFFDGGAGTARQTRRLLAERGLLAPAGSVGSVELRSSIDTPQELALYRQFLEMSL